MTAAKAKGFAWLEAEQRNFYDALWSKGGMEIQGSAHVQQGIHFNLFHMEHSLGHEGRTTIPAKALMGEGYNGHYGWDAKVYVMPFFLHTNPYMARLLLLHQFHTLGAARCRAHNFDIYQGCLFPWQRGVFIVLCGQDGTSAHQHIHCILLRESYLRHQRR